MKILQPHHTWKDVEIGDEFQNTTLVAYSLPEIDSRHHLMTQCKLCGRIQRQRFDNVHTKDATKAPHSSRCPGCGIGHKRAMDCIWTNETAKKDTVNFDRINDLSGMTFGTTYVVRPARTGSNAHVYYYVIKDGVEKEMRDDYIKQQA